MTPHKCPAGRSTTRSAEMKENPPKRNWVGDTGGYPEYVTRHDDGSECKGDGTCWTDEQLMGVGYGE
jgi:hypothetical protein